jgi:hypothetical protein
LQKKDTCNLSPFLLPSAVSCLPSSETAVQAVFCVFWLVRCFCPFPGATGGHAAAESGWHWAAVFSDFSEAEIFSFLSFFLSLRS